MVPQLEPHARRAKDLADIPDAAGSYESLALLYQGLFTGIVRLQSGRQQIPDAESFRRRTKATLHEVERVAIASGYDGSDVRGTHFAVVAFLDAVVLHSADPVRAEWERKTLQEELFGQTDAGVVFFEKLEQFSSRRDSEQLADILEVFLLCLLLGFQGRYSDRLRGELEVIMERLRARIEDIRGHKPAISPQGLLPDEAVPAAQPRVRRNQFLKIALAAAVFTIVCFLLFYWNLYWFSDSVLSRLS